jgi:glutamate dehydrogenase/leucine dehydrogenase
MQGGFISSQCFPFGLDKFKRQQKVVAISDITGALKNTNGLDIPSIIRYSKENGNIKDFMEVDAIDTKCLLREECDVLIPSALWGNKLNLI